VTDTGVVDPIRVPAWLRGPVEEAWRETPPLARLFIGLALVDIVSRGLGILQPRYDIGGDLFGAYFMLVPHDLWILLPAILLLRRPDAASATPLTWWGGVVAAVATLVERPLASLLGGPFGPTNLSIEISILTSIGLVLAFLLLARGLAELNPVEPTASAAGFSNIVIGLGGLGILVGVVQSVVGDLAPGIPAIAGLLALSSVVFGARQAAWLYLLWLIIRGLGDTRRASLAITVGVIGASIAGLLSPSGAILGAMAAAIPGAAGASGLGSLAYALNLLGVGIGEALVLVAFALGLAEPPVPYLEPAPLAPVAPPAEEARAAEEAPPTVA
jgi:hypothetical protein